MYNTIQITRDVDRLILKLKRGLGLTTKKDVVVTALNHLAAEHERRLKEDRLKKASLAVREHSLKINADFAPGAYIVRHDNE